MYFIHLPMKMEPIVSSETSAIRTQTPGNYPKRNKLHFLNMSMRFASVLTKQSWIYSKVPQYQNFLIIGGQIKGILLYLYLHQEWSKNFKISNHTFT